MKATDTGMTRKVDELGRIVLPAEIRRSFEIKVKDGLDVSVSNGEIILHPSNKCIRGMVRKVDELGRIVLPIEIRKSFGIEEGDYLDISVCENEIILTPPNKCFCCGAAGEDGNLVEVNGKRLCGVCLRKFNDKKEGAPRE